MKATEINIKLALKPGEGMATVLNRVITCIQSGHYQGRTISESTFEKDGYNFSYTKEDKEYENIDFK
jgi:hypothetical protein